MPDPIDRALSVRQLARRWTVSPRKVRAMIRAGLLAAIDVGACRRQLRILPEAIAQAEARMTVAPPAPRRRRRETIEPEIARLLDG